MRSLPFWSLVSLIALLGFWFVSTYAWGFPEEFKDPELSDKLRIAACNSDPECKGSFSQLLKPLQFPSVRDTWNTFFELKDDVPAETWREHMAMEELQVEDDQRERIVATLREVRGD